jgi:flagellar biosynthesis protein FlhF
MSAPVQTPGVPGQKYKFVVSSAEEAVTVIRERLGDKAQVLSVRQVEGEGLSRFLRSPKLQVIATVPEAGVKFGAAEGVQPAAPGSAAVAAASAAFAASAQARADESDRVSLQGDVVRRTAAGGGGARFWSILEKAGLPKEFLGRLRQGEAWRDLGDQPLPMALGRAALLLKEAMPVRQGGALGDRVAFFGSPGVGATTALCKQLANDVFFQQRTPTVLKLDSEEPNSTEGLATFCEVLGVPLLRSEAELGDRGGALYLDVPGAILGGPGGERLGRLLDAHRVSSRVLVVNAAYERELIQHAYTQGAALGATHVVFTHLDELPRTGKLWEFALDEKLAPLFASTGRNLAGDLEANLVEFLVERTFAVACA